MGTSTDAGAAALDAALDRSSKRSKLSHDEQGDSVGGSGAAAADGRHDGVLNEALLGQESVEALAAAYAAALPYQHTVLRQPFEDSLLRNVRDEIIQNINATYKETDLFKVFQTGDFGNLAKVDADVAAKIPSLMRLKAALYSERFRAFVRSITGCGELSGQTDCSCNVYASGGHLLAHDDVIGTRRVSWIIYLTEPDEPWTAADGGALELYPQEEGVAHTPAVDPTVSHLPEFNTMAMFTVMPGKSFHSVQEVFSDDKPRMSISGWYHAPTAPEDAAKASLQQLQSMRAGQDLEGAHYEPFRGCSPAEEASELSDDDLALLIKFVNPSYLNEDSWPKIQAKFEEDGSVQLQSFLKTALANRILGATAAADAADGLGCGRPPASHVVGTGCGWSAVGPPHKQRFLRYTAAAAAATHGAESTSVADTPGELLEQVRTQLFASGAFCRLLRKFTTLNMVGHRSDIRRFRPGLDYTVAHYGILTKDPRLDVVLCFVDNRLSNADAERQHETGGGAGGGDTIGDAGAPSGPPPRKGVGLGAPGRAAASSSSSAPGRPVLDGAKVAAWDCGEVGGFEAYLLAEDDKDGEGPEDTYRTKDDDSGVLNVSAAANSLNLVLRDEGLMKFVKYVSAAAPSSRWDVAMECLPEPDSDDEAADNNTKDA
uniref:Fe2OG dioxygenase domain-containing protein n=1 Tax=Chlamydomonas euryale TaxID=1486919 RepID=A0A7R9YSB2_9CHLO|mmetsp:Transcript_17157/g.51493  ORF Transcript_17157/g.51493 Transcript_17157/m.51493 type:complete len:658 (+) Transcript_17157:222-2195(+)